MIFLQYRISNTFKALLLGCIHALFDNAYGFDLEIISVIPYNLSLGVALPWTGAALQLAAENVRSQFSPDLNLSVTLLYQNKDRLCEDANINAMLLLTDYYYKQAFNRCVAFIASACGGLASAPYLAKEWNVLLFSNSLASTKLFNPVTAPTSIGMPGSYEGLAAALLKLFRHFKWFHVTLLKDSLGTTEYYWELFRATQSLAKSTEQSDFRIDGFSFTPSDRQSMDEALTQASRKSRGKNYCVMPAELKVLLQSLKIVTVLVFLILAHTLVAIKFLRIARENGIVSGEYVFVVCQPMQQSVYGVVSLFNNPTEADIDLFQSVLYLTSYALAVNGTDELNNMLTKREKTAYGTILENGTKPLDLYAIRETYNSVKLFAALVNESLSLIDNRNAKPIDVCGGRKLKSLTVNRTFKFPSGLVEVHSDGSRQIDLLLYAFDMKQRMMQVAAHYESSSQNYIWHSQLTFEKFVAVSDIPVCGFSGFEGRCTAEVHWNLSISLPVLLILFIGLSIASWILIRWKLQAYFNDMWWLVLVTDLKFVESTKSRALLAAVSAKKPL